jgi:hypothetical protein
VEVPKREHPTRSIASAVRVPTFILGNDAAFVRLTDRPAGNTELATSTIERVLDRQDGCRRAIPSRAV